MAKKNKILLTGIGGFLAPFLYDEFIKDYNITTTGRSHGDIGCDLEDERQIAMLLADSSPDIIIHTAAMTDVDECEKNPEKAFNVNALVVQNLVSHMSKQSRIVLFSTDQVYPDCQGPHHENETGPVNEYGKTKLEGERYSLEHSNSLVLRTNFFGASRTKNRVSLSDWMISSLEKHKPITLFNDILFSPLHIKTLSELTRKLVEINADGVINVGCRDGASKSDFGLEIAKRFSLSTDGVSIESSSSIPGRAKRPHDMRLNIDRVESLLNQRMPTMKEEIRKL